MAEVEVRLRELETQVAVSRETVKSIQVSVGEMRDEIKTFLNSIQHAITLSTDVQTLRVELKAVCDRSKTLQEQFSEHIKEYISLDNRYASLKAAHDSCLGGQTTERHWWKDRLGRLADWVVPAAIIYFLWLYRIHSAG